MTEPLVVTNQESQRLAIVTVGTGIIAESDSIPRFRDAMLLAPGSGSVVSFGFDPGTPHYLTEVALPSGRVLRSTPVTQLSGTVNGCTLDATTAVDAMFTNSGLLVLQAVRACADVGVAVYTWPDLALKTFLPNLRVPASGAMATISANLVVFAGRRSSDPSSLARLFIVDAGAGSIVDSSQSFTASGLLATGIRAVVWGGASSLGFVIASDSELRSYDRTSGTSSVLGHVSGFARLAFDQGLNEVLVFDPGDGRDFPGPPTVRRFTTAGQELAPIDVHGALPGGIDPIVRNVGRVPNGPLLLLTGTSSVGPLYPLQQSRVLLLSDGATVARQIPLGRWGATRLVVVAPQPN